ncbi:MAG: AsmA family protein [candidate division KSB1 bacterium]|nr:AsmA family protein [candidate division KSB1 bacterium]
MTTSRAHTSLPRRRRWFLLVGGTLALYLLLLAAGFALLQALLPSERVKQAVIATLESQLGRKIAVAEVRVNPFSGITLHQVEIQTPVGADTFAFPARAAKVERVRLHYRLLPLFRRRVEIDEISLHEPRLDLVFAVRQKPAGSVRRAEPEYQRADSVARTASALPVALDLRRVEIRQAACTVTIRGDSSEMAFGLEGLSFAAAGLRVPRREGDPWGAAEGRAQLKCTRAPVFFRQSGRTSTPIAASGALDFELTAEAHTLADVEATLDIGVHRARLSIPAEEGSLLAGLMERQLPSVELRAQAKGDVLGGNYALQRLSLSLARQQLLALSGALHDLGGRPAIEVAVEEGEISLGRLIETLRPLFANTDLSSRLPSQLSGRLSLAGTGLRGKLPSASARHSLEAVGRVHLGGLTFSLPTVAEADSLTFSVEGTGRLDSAGLREAAAICNLWCRRAVYRSPGLPIALKGTRLALETRVPRDAQLLRVNADLQADSALGGSLASKVHISAGRTSADWQGTVQVEVTALPLAQLSTGQLEGQATASFAAELRTLKDIALHTRVVLESLAAKLNGGMQPLPPLELVAAGKARITPWSTFALDSLLVELPDFASVRLVGEFETRKQQASVILQDLAISHHALPRLLPQDLQDELGELWLSGETHLRSHGFARLGPGQPRFDARGQLSIMLAGEFPTFGVEVSGVRVGADFDLTPDLGRTQVDLQVDTLVFAALGAAPVTGTSAHFELLLPELRRLVLAQGHVAVPIVAARADLTGTMELHTDGPRAFLEADLHVQATDTVRFMDTIKFVGEVHAPAALRMNGSVVNINGSLVIPAAAVVLPGGVSLRGIRADIPFAHAFDLSTMQVLSASEERFAFAGPAGRYPELFVPHFTQTLPEQGWLTVERLSFAGYGASNLRMSTFIGGGKVLVPSLLIDAYDGNFGGSVAAELPTVDLADATYRIAGHLSGVNSALLAARSGQPPEKGIINANFFFAGRGLDVAKGIEVEGSFRITEIGPRVADNLLRALDPQGVDAGIRSARFFINHGFKPRLINFDLRHGHLYPSIRLSQPWYFPVRIGGGRVELARIPLAFFLQMLKQETLPAY